MASNSTSGHIPKINENIHAKLLQSCPTLWDPMDRSPPDSSVPGILQARILEWVAIPFSNCFHCFPTIFYEVMGLDAMILVF